MRYFDLHMHSAFSEGESSIEQLASIAKELGYSGICFSEYFKDDQQIKKLQEDASKVKETVGIGIYIGFEARNMKELERLIERRRRFDVLLVHGGDLKLNRIACETPQVDILTHPELDRNDSGLNHVLVKAAAANDVAIEMNFREVLGANKRSRSKLIANIGKNMMLAKKFHAPIILCSGAVSHFEMRDPLVLVSFATQLGLKLDEAKESLSKVPEKILKQSKERRDGKWISPGVKII